MGVGAEGCGGVTLEVRIPISPTPTFINRTRLLAASVREFYPDALVKVYVGEHDMLMPGGFSETPAAARFDSVAWMSRRVMEEWRGTANEYAGVMAARYAPPFDGTHILMLDADVIVTRRFDELFDIDALSGVQAHVPPFGRAAWSLLYQHAGLVPEWRPHEYSGFGSMFTDESARFGPPYMNTGVVFGPAARFEQLYETYAATLRDLRLRMNSYFFEQIALTLAAAKSKTPLHILPLRYNFPNQTAFEMRHPAELADCRFLHYLRTDTVDRDADFADQSAIQRLIYRAGLTGANEMLRARVAELRGAAGLSVPEPLSRVEDVPWA